MKAVFTEDEKKWLNDKINGALYVAGVRGDATLVKALGKMKYKFTPEAAYVNLTGRDRALIASMLAYRHQALGTTSISPEVEILNGIAGKILERE